MNITLIGMPNAGKSIIGKELAKRLNYESIDTDTIITKNLNLNLQQIVERFGEHGFLEIEEQTILKLGKDAQLFDNCIISPGGSVIYSTKTMEFLKGISIIVFLKASFESINKRISGQPIRKIIGLQQKGLKALFDERLFLYEKYADITIEMPEEFNMDETIKRIQEGIRGKEEYASEK